MFVALLSIVFGVALVISGIIVAIFSFSEYEGLRALYGILGGVFISLFGVFVEIYMGWWGMVRAIIDYAKT